MEWLLLIPVIAAFLLSFLLVLLSLPGNFMLAGLAFFYGLGTGFSEVTGRVVLVLLGVAVIGELLEFGAGILFSRKYGASVPGALGSVAGGIAGGVIGAGAGLLLALPGAFIGAFAGAFIVEYLRFQKLESAARAGTGAFFGRIAGILFKGLAGCAICVIFLASVL